MKLATYFSPALLIATVAIAQSPTKENDALIKGDKWLPKVLGAA